MFCAVSAARDICVSFGFSYRADIPGSLIFDYNSGQSEHFGEKGHLVPLYGGFWSSRSVDLNIISQVYICSSAMEAIAFICFNSSRFNRPFELLFIAIGPHYAYPEEIFKELGKVKINLVLGNDLIDVLRAIRFCMEYRGIKVYFILQDELVVFRFTERIFFISQHRLSLRQFFLSAKIRPFFRQYLPKSKISFLHDFLNQ
jgi:hypothetical protein